MLGQVEDLVPFVHPRSRLRQGLQLLQDCVAGRLPEIMNQVSSLTPGETSRIPLGGDALYLLVQCYQPRAREQGRFEAHERHTDLQFLLSGRECIEVCDLRSQQPLPPYDSHGNLYFPMGAEPHSRLLLQAGAVAVLLPEDAHAPCLSPGGDGKECVRKLVVKIKDAHLPDLGADKDSTDVAAVEPAVAGCNK
jgi:biofilm protein TabA